MINHEKPKRVRAQKTKTKRTKRKYMLLSKILYKCNMRGNCKRLSDLVQARKFQEIWNIEYPIIVKPLHRSHVSGCCLMALPVQFCKTHLPVEDTIMVLENERGEQYDTKYLTSSTPGLSGGWRRFARDNKLVAGDVIVFQLVKATRFKVYIIKADAAIAVTVPTSSHDSDTHSKQSVSSEDQLIVYKRRKSHRPSEPSTIKKDCVDLTTAEDSKIFKLSGEEVHFKNVTSFKDFNIVINKLLQNQRLPECILQAYYELCCSKRAFLHANLFKSINSRWSDWEIAGAVKNILSETVNIANALRTCTLSTSQDDFSLWNRTLNVYEALGMNVRFLHARLHRLQNLAFSSEGALDRRKYIEASYERVRSEGEVKKLEAILAKLRKVSKMLAAKVEYLESKADSKRYMETCYQLVFANDEVQKLEVLVNEFGDFFRWYDGVIESLKSKAKNHDSTSIKRLVLHGDNYNYSNMNSIYEHLVKQYIDSTNSRP